MSISEEFYEEETSQEEERIDIQKYIRGVLKRWWLVLIIFFGITIPWAIYLKKQPPVYEAYAVIRFKSYDSEGSEFLNRSRMTELRSRTFAERVVAQLGLTLSFDPEQRGVTRRDIFSKFSTTTKPISGDYELHFTKDGRYSIYRVIEMGKNKYRRQLVDSGSIAEAIEQERSVNGFTFRFAPTVERLPKVVKFKITRFRKAVKSFQSKTNVRLNRAGTLMIVSMTDKDPVLVAQMVNRLSEIYVDESISVKRRNIEKRRKILEERKAIAEQQLKEADEALKRFKESHFISLDTEVKTQVEDLSRFEGERDELIGQRESLAVLLEKLKTSTPDSLQARYVYRQITTHPSFEQDPNMGLLRQQLLDLETRRGRLLERVTENHPDVLEIDSQIKDIHWRIKKAAESRLTYLNKRIFRLTRNINGLRAQLQKLPSEEQKLAELTRQRKIKEQIYSKLLLDYQEVQLSEAVEAEDVDILDPAIPPEYPTNRGKKRMAMLGAFFALVMGLSVAVVLEFLDKSIKTPEDVKKHLKLPLLGTIPKVYFDHKYELQDFEKIRQIDSQLVTHDYSPTSIGEAYRALRTKIMFSKTIGRIQTLLLTSPAPGDGKSFTAANLAIALAQHKTNTLLVDADLRRGVLHNTFACPKEPGLSNYLTGFSILDEIISETYVPNLSLVSCGSMVPNPSELLGSFKMRQLIEEAKRKFDVIIFDTPPLNAATDAVVLSTQTDAVAVVVLCEATNKDVAKRRLELFESVPARVIGVILNGTKTEMAHPGYSYYHY